MAALPHPVAPAGSLAEENAASRERRAAALWLAVELLEPEPDRVALESLAAWAESLTPTVVLRPGEGLLLEVQGSLRYFDGLAAIRQRLTAELDRRGWVCRLAMAPTPLAASWLVRCAGSDEDEQGSPAAAIGRLPLAATGWPAKVQRLLGQMGLESIGDCLRLPRAGFARRVGRVWLDELDRALGKKPDPRTGWRAPESLSRQVELSPETSDRALFAAALDGMAESLEHELRRRQAQVASVTLRFRHLRCEDTSTRIRFVDPVHESGRILDPLLARIECVALAEPAIALSLRTSELLPLRAGQPGLLPVRGDDPPAAAAAAVPEFALVERLRGRFGTRSVYGIGTVAEHRPEYAWRRRIDPRAAAPPAGPVCPPHGRPLWLLPEPRKRNERCQKKRCQTPFSKKVSDTFSDTFFPERIESGWWDGRDVRRDYFVVTGEGGERLWCYRDCRTREWYLHGIFG